MNNLLKRVKRVAFGFTNFENFRIRALLYAGKPNFRVFDSIVVARDVAHPAETGRPKKAPPAGLEPAPPAPEAGALSAELRGQEQGTIVVGGVPVPSREHRGLPYPSPMPTDLGVATAAVERALLPRTATVGPDGHLRVGDIDLVELADEFGTPLFVYDEDHLRHACREAVAAWGDGVAYATKAFLCRAMARLANEEGMQLDVASGGELHVALSAGVPPERLVLHGNNKSEAELAAALECGVGRIVVDSFDEIARLGRLLDGAIPTPGPSQGPGPGDPRGGGSHPRVRAHRVRRTPNSGSPWLRARQPKRLPPSSSCPGWSWSACTRTSGARSLRRRPSSRRPRSWAPSSPRSICPSSWWGVGSEWRMSMASRRPPRPNGPPPPGPRCARVGCRPSTRLSAEPGRSIVAAAGVTLYTVGTVKPLPGIRTYVSVDGGMSDNPRPVLYGSGYEAFLPRAVGAARPRPTRLVGKHCESGDLVVPDALRARGPARRGRRGHAGHRRLRVCHGVQLQQGAAPGRGVRGRWPCSHRRPA